MAGITNFMTPSDVPNEPGAVDGGIPAVCKVEHTRPAATDPERSLRRRLVRMVPACGSSVRASRLFGLP